MKRTIVLAPILLVGLLVGGLLLLGRATGPESGAREVGESMGSSWEGPSLEPDAPPPPVPAPTPERRAAASDSEGGALPAAQQAPEPAVLSGWVLASDGQRVPGLEFTCSNGVGPLRTDGEGAFQTIVERPGKLRLAARSFGLSAELDLELAPGEERTGVELRFPPGGWVAGRMLDGEGRALALRSVHATPDASDARKVLTDSGGEFRLGPLAPGEYEVYGFTSGDRETAPAEEYLAALVSAPASVLAGRVTRVLLQPPAGAKPRLAGVLLRAGQPLAGAQLLAIREARSYLAGPRTARTDAAGRFDLELAGAGRHLLLVYAPDSATLSLRRFVDVPEGGLRDLVLEHPDGALELALQGELGAGVTVTLEPLDCPINFRPVSGKRRLSRTKSTRPRFDHLDAGTYRLTVTAEHGAAEVRELELAEGEELLVPLRLGEGGRLRVHFTGAPPLPDSLNLVLLDARGRPRALGDARHSPARGAWTSELLPVGRYSIVATALDGRAAASAWAPVEVGEASEVVLELGMGARLSLSARALGAPVPAGFRIFDAEERELTGLYLPPNGAELVPMRSDEGHFGPLPPGRYRATASASYGTRGQRSVDLAAGRDLRVELEVGLPR